MKHKFAWMKHIFISMKHLVSYGETKIHHIMSHYKMPFMLFHIEAPKGRGVAEGDDLIKNLPKSIFTRDV